MKRFRRGVLLVSALALIALWSVVTLGAGRQSQFCPTTLEHRGVVVYYVPFTDIVVWTSPHETERRRIVRFWYDEGHARADGPPQQWHVITSRVPWRRFSSSGPAQAFWNWTGCGLDEGAGEWIAWSRRHPELAADLWPRVVGLLRRAGTEGQLGESYYEAMRLMLTVRGVGDEAGYRERIAEWQRRCAEARGR